MVRLLVLFLGGSLPGVADGSPATLTIATYNVENYGPANRLTSDGFRPGYPKPEAEKRALRVVLRKLDADVLALQELGGESYLEELRRDLRTEGLDYPHVAVAADAERQVTLLAKPALRKVATADLDFPYIGGRQRVKRGVLEATVATAAGDVTIFVLHLKSRLTERPEDPEAMKFRAAEARAVRDHILRRFPHPSADQFVVLGDCNAGRTSAPLRYLQKRGTTEIARLLPATDSRGEVWTYAYRREETYSRVDHILVSPGLHPLVRDGAAWIYDGPSVPAASDHRPVVAVLNVAIP